MILQGKRLYALIAFISIISLFSFLASPLFQVHSLDFKGLKNLTVSELREELQNYYQRNIWLIDKRELKYNLIKNNYIKEVSIRKVFPDNLLINISERIPIAKINNNGIYLIFTADGFILEKGSLKGRAKVPEVKGIGYSFAEDKLVFSLLLEKIVQALREIDSHTRSDIIEIYRENDKGIIVNLSQRFPAYLGNEDDLIKKFRVLESILEKIQKENLSVDYIDLRIIQKPVVKLKKVS